MTSRSCFPARRRSRGFTLIELMITVMLLAVVVITLTTVMYAASRSKTMSANNIEASEAGRVALDMVARDLRSAGYGADLDYTARPQTPIAYVDSMQVLINANLEPYPDTASAGHATPLAYDPTGSPRPQPLSGTDWTPPIRYTTGAEIVRWTLDLNNDGLVDAVDQGDANAVDAQRTPNPDDYELVRQVYGDYTNNAAGNNGPVTQRIALVRRPGGGVSPLFTVYMKGSTTAWDWSNGPVPAGQLGNIERVAVQITAPSGKRDWLGRYAESRYNTEVNSLRNTPQTSADEYVVDGYAFNDSIVVNRVRDTGEVGLGGATIQLGVISTTTSSNGYFCLHVPAGTYTLRQLVPPAGFVNSSNPESLSVTVPPATSHSFANTAIAGGHVSVFVYNDIDNDGVQDGGEPGRQGVKVTMSAGGISAYTDATGNLAAALFAPVGACSVSVAPPDSFVATTTNPIQLTIANGDSRSLVFGVGKPATGTVRGTVYRDTDKDGTLDTGEQGFQNVWVGVTTDGGVTVPGWAYTDANGEYSIDVPANDPPRTTTYSIMILPPAGFFPTSATSINGIYLTAGQSLASQNFGVASFTVITLTANKVLCLGSADLMEKESVAPLARGDADIVLGSDTGGSDEISVWFNQYSGTPLFNATRSYTRTNNKMGSVLSMALDYIDGTTLTTPDLVTGCTYYKNGGNFFVWWCQTTSGNEGYFASSPSRSYETADQGAVQAVVSLDCAGSSSAADKPDLIVGTKSTTAYLGSIELWTNSNVAAPTFSRTETYPTSGGFTAGSLGEVTSLVAGDFNGDGLKDLAVGTRTAIGGKVHILRNMGKTASPHFLLQSEVAFTGDAVTKLAVVDVDGDGLLDVVAGLETTAGGGRLVYLKNRTGAFTFDVTRTVDAPGVVTSLVVADLGGSTRGDLAVGYRVGTTLYVGGVTIYYLDGGNIPPNGMDPSAGALVNWVPALNANNFNYGTNPAASAPYLTDLAVGVKVSDTTGALVVFIR